VTCHVSNPSIEGKRPTTEAKETYYGSKRDLLLLLIPVFLDLVPATSACSRRASVEIKIPRKEGKRPTMEAKETY
jgi:hypothetical protein